MAVVLADLLDERQITLQVRARERNEALRELVRSMQGSGKIQDADKFFAAVIDRENTSSTVAENGVAFPHARTDLVSEIVLGIGRSTEGVRFDESGKLVHLIFLIGVPRQMIQDYLVCVGALARLTRDDETRATLMEAGTAREFIEQLRTASLQLE